MTTDKNPIKGDAGLEKSQLVLQYRLCVCVCVCMRSLSGTAADSVCVCLWFVGCVFKVCPAGRYWWPVFKMCWCSSDETTASHVLLTHSLSLCFSLYKGIELTLGVICMITHLGHIHPSVWKKNAKLLIKHSLCWRPLWFFPHCDI